MHTPKNREMESSDIELKNYQKTRSDVHDIPSERQHETHANQNFECQHLSPELAIVRHSIDMRVTPLQQSTVLYML